MHDYPDYDPDYYDDTPDMPPPPGWLEGEEVEPEKEKTR